MDVHGKGPQHAKVRLNVRQGRVGLGKPILDEAGKPRFRRTQLAQGPCRFHRLAQFRGLQVGDGILADIAKVQACLFDARLGAGVGDEVDVVLLGQFLAQGEVRANVALAANGQDGDLHGC